jgi:hypothetical protein
LTVSCSQTAKKAGPVDDEKKPKTLTPIEVMAAYQDAMKAFWSRIDPATEEVFQGYKELWQKMGWAEIKEDSLIVAMSQGEFVAHSAVYNPKHPKLKVWGPTLQTAEVNNRSMVLIRPEPMTEQWRAIFMVHELAHVVLALRKVDISLAENELAAYEIEKLALNATSKFKLDKKLDKALKKFGVTHESQVLALDQGKAQEVFRKIDGKISDEASRNLYEEEMRMGFYHVALGYRFVENTKLSTKKKRERMIVFVRSFLDKFGKKY